MKPDTITYSEYKNENRCSQQTIDTSINTMRYPNLQIGIHSCNKLSTIEFPLDDSGGHLILSGEFLSLEDTIRIRKFTVFHNCLPDTTKSSVSWLRRYPLDSISPLKLLRFKKEPDKIHLKDCDLKYPDSISLTINGKPHTTSLKIKNSKGAGYISWYHGHKKMTKRAERKYEQRIADGKSYVYFAGTTERRKYFLTARISLQ